MLGGDCGACALARLRGATRACQQLFTCCGGACFVIFDFSAAPILHHQGRAPAWALTLQSWACRAGAHLRDAQLRGPRHGHLWRLQLHLQCWLDHLHAAGPGALCLLQRGITNFPGVHHCQRYYG